MKELELAYGENPHQQAAYYRGPGQHLLSDVEKLHGRDLSFINLYDLAAAVGLIVELGDEPACVIVKHANPCGVAVAGHDRARPTSAPTRATRCRPSGW